MKKRDIMRLIKNIKEIERSKLLPLYEYCSCDNDALNNLKYLIKNNSELKILYDKEKKAQQQYDDFKLNCNHPIRIKEGFEDDWDWFNQSYYSYTYRCIFCDHKIPGKKLDADWVESYYYNNCVYINDVNFDVWNYILNILLDKKDDEEIDFIKEFKKLNLDSRICEINDKKRIENNILIINVPEQSGDVNSEFIKKELDILKNLLKIDDLRIKIFSNRIYLKQYYRKEQFLLNKNITAVEQNYQNLYDLKEEKNMHIPIKLVINFSPHIYFYSKGERIQINEFIKEMFPNCIIVNLNKSDLTKLNSKMIQELTDYVQNVVNSETAFNREDIKKFVKKYDMGEKYGQIIN